MVTMVLWIRVWAVVCRMEQVAPYMQPTRAALSSPRSRTWALTTTNCHQPTKADTVPQLRHTTTTSSSSFHSKCYHSSSTATQSTAFSSRRTRWSAMPWWPRLLLFRRKILIKIAGMIRLMKAIKFRERVRCSSSSSEMMIERWRRR